MRTIRVTCLVLLVLAGCIARPHQRRPRPPLECAVATVHPLATQAGLDAVAAGGNAVDAAIAAALTLGIVDIHNSGIGGGCFLMIRRADGDVLVIDGRETAPAAATRDMYVRDGAVDPTLSVEGALAVGVPGSLAAFDHAARVAGRLPLRAALRRAATLAEGGFPIGMRLAERFASKQAALRKLPATRAAFLDPDGNAWPEGHVLKQPDLAKTYRAIAREGVGHFYGGAFARKLETWMRANGGVATAKDFADYRIRRREPVRSRYRGHEILGFPPPSSGGVHVAQILTMLERFELASLDEATRRHVVAEAMKLAFADRAHWLGDPAFADVPKGLCADGYCESLSAKIRLDAVVDVESHGSPPNADEDLFKHTTHIATADSAGNWVALTTTINTSFGSKVVIPGTGVVMNNQMDDFSARPGVPNAYGLVGAEANRIAPGKRPLSSMSPTLVLRDGHPVLTLGGAGGPTIISQVVQVLIYVIDLEMDLLAALAAPRIHHQWRPDELRLEDDVSASVRRALERLGHRVAVTDAIGVAQAVGVDRGGRLVAVREPRLTGPQ